MIIKIGDNIQLGGNSKYQLEPGISGLSSANIRTGDGVYSGRDGGYVSSQLYGTRTITMTGFYIGENCEEADNLRRGLVSNLHIRYLYPIYITTFSQQHYFTEGYVTDIKSDIEGRRSGEFQITLLCPDPIMYDGGDGLSSDSAWIEQRFMIEKAGGFVIEYPTPVPWQSGQQNTIIFNNGSVYTYPIINLTGTFTSPITVRNLTTGKFITLTGRNITPLQTLLIDMKERTITLDGVSIADARSIDSTWWGLEVGQNRIVLESGSSTDTDFGMIRFKQGYEGI